MPLKSYLQPKITLWSAALALLYRRHGLLRLLISIPPAAFQQRSPSLTQHSRSQFSALLQHYENSVRATFVQRLLQRSWVAKAALHERILFCTGSYKVNGHKIFCNVFVLFFSFWIFIYSNSVLFWINFLEVILNTFEQDPIWFCNLATKNLRLATIFYHLVAKWRLEDFFNFEPWHH